MATSMKIGEETETYSTAVFTFPNNPKLVDADIVPNRQFMNIPFVKIHSVSDFGGMNPKNIILNGTMHGSSKRTNFNSLAKHVHDMNIKKFFISDTRFYYFLGNNLKETLSGDKTNFIDYVANLWTPIPYCLSDTTSTYTVTDLTGTGTTILNDATALSTGAFTNAGNAPAFVKWVFANQAGSDTITQLEVGDSSTIAGSSRVITWQGSLPAGSTLTIYVFKFYTQTGGSKLIKPAYCEVGSSESGSRSVKGGVTGVPYINPETTDQAFSIRINNGGSFAAGNLDVTATWNESYLS